MAYDNTYIALDKITLGSNTAFATFSSIPSTYTDLIVVVAGQVSSNVSLACQVNGDTGNNYSVTEIFGDGTTASSFRTTNNAQITVASIGAQINSGSQWVSTLHFQNYANTSTNKTIIGRTSAPGTGANAISSQWRSTAAINSIKIMGFANASGFTTGTTFSLYGIAATGSNPPAKATGGTISYTSTGYTVHTFNSTGTFTPTTAITNAEYLVIAGGGAGGVNQGAGGGAGGYRCSVVGESSGGGASAESRVNFASGTAYTIQVGAGGTGGFNSTPQAGANGTASSIAGSGFTTISTVGGGGGGAVGFAGQNGGSGGGAGGSGVVGTGTANQGYAGFSSAGGGAGGVSATGAQGGIGLFSAITGTPVGRAGGSAYQFTSAYGAGLSDISQAATNGQNNTGSGGSPWDGTYNSGSGGSGVVIIRYASV